VPNLQPIQAEDPDGDDGDDAQAAPAAPATQAQAAPADANGQWVYTAQYGWVWMPYGAGYTYVSTDEASDPYMYVYYPSFGWRWLEAPWVFGWGPSPYWGSWGCGRFAWYSHPWFNSHEYRGSRHSRYGGWAGNRGVNHSDLRHGVSYGPSHGPSHGAPVYNHPGAIHAAGPVGQVGRTGGFRSYGPIGPIGSSRGGGWGGNRPLSGAPISHGSARGGFSGGGRGGGGSGGGRGTGTGHGR
jgi:hypothetical protein